MTLNVISLHYISCTFITSYLLLNFKQKCVCIFPLFKIKFPISRWKLYGSYGSRYSRVLIDYSSWEPYTSTGISGPNMAILPNYPYPGYPYYELSLKIWRWGQDEANHGIYRFLAYLCFSNCVFVITFCPSCTQ